MGRSVFALLIVTTLETLLPAASHADPYRWCAEYGRPGGTNCGFVTWEQCQDTLRRMGGFCVRNPFYTGADRQTVGSGRAGPARPERLR